MRGEFWRFRQAGRTVTNVVLPLHKSRLRSAFIYQGRQWSARGIAIALYRRGSYSLRIRLLTTKTALTVAAKRLNERAAQGTVDRLGIQTVHGSLAAGGMLTRAHFEYAPQHEQGDHRQVSPTVFSHLSATAPTVEVKPHRLTEDNVRHDQIVPSS